ncbi:MAG: hypothetical protein JWQ08_1370, partial [Deinococcus sp.]|nr:hypothetical protein [Deinococcus sp.]
MEVPGQIMGIEAATPFELITSSSSGAVLRITPPKKETFGGS